MKSGICNTEERIHPKTKMFKGALDISYLGLKLHVAHFFCQFNIFAVGEKHAEIFSIQLAICIGQTKIKVSLFGIRCQGQYKNKMVEKYC